MRPKVVIAVLLLATFALVGIHFLNKAISPHSAEAPKETAAIPAMEPSPPISAIPVQPLPVPAPTPVVVAAPVATNQPALTPAEISATIKRLEELEWNDDPVSLQAILKELTNSSPVVRHAAIEATIQFRDRTAIPVLRDLAARAENPEEKKELSEAADFMALPTLSEVRAAKKAAQSTSSTQP